MWVHVEQMECPSCAQHSLEDMEVNYHDKEEHHTIYCAYCGMSFVMVFTDGL